MVEKRDVKKEEKNWEERKEEVQREETKKIIGKMMKRKVAEQNKISNEAWIYGVEEDVNAITKYIEKIRNKGIIPRKRRIRVLKQIYKKGNKDKAENNKRERLEKREKWKWKTEEKEMIESERLIKGEKIEGKKF